MYVGPIGLIRVNLAIYLPFQFGMITNLNMLVDIWQITLFNDENDLLCNFLTVSTPEG